MNTVFYIKTYKTEINTNSKINITHEHLLTEISSQSPKTRSTFAFVDLENGQRGSTIHTKRSHGERRDEKATLNDVIIDKNYVMQ